MGRISQDSKDTEVKGKRRAKKINVRHILAVLAGAICFAVAFMYTGDADLLFAISSGLIAGAVSLLAANAAIALRSSKS